MSVPNRPPFDIGERMWEWLTGRMDRQDYMLDAILKEQRKTNGHVLDHESRLQTLEQAERAGEKKEAKNEADQVREDEKRSRRREWGIGILAVLLGGALVQPFAHLMHLLFA